MKDTKVTLSAISVAIRFLMIPVFVNATNIWRPKNAPPLPVCVKPQCQAMGREMYANMDRSVNPCNNFYDYVCGSWAKNPRHPGRQGMPEWGIHGYLYLQTLEELRKIFESNRLPANNIEYQHAKMVYETCAKIPELLRKSPTELGNYIYRIGRYPSTSLWQLHNGYLKLTGESAIFDYQVLANSPVEKIPLLVFLEKESPYGSIRHDMEWKPQEEKAYLNYLYLLVKVMKLPGNAKEIQELMKKVFEFRKAFSKLSEESRLQEVGYFNPMSPTELEDWYRMAIDVDDEAADVPWEASAKILLKNLPNKLLDESVVAFRRPFYRNELAALLSNTPKEVIASHMELYFIERHIEISDAMYKLLEATITQPEKNPAFLKTTWRRWEMCLGSHSMKETMGKILMEYSFPPAARPIIVNIIRKVKESMKNQMRQSKWLDQPTRSQMEKELDKLNDWIGCPPWYTDSSIPARDDHPNILMPNAIYDRLNSAICIYISYLRQPIFDPNLPDVYNFGGLGSTIGHELHHIIYDCGSFPVSSPGKHNRTWWSLKMRSECIKRKQCFVQQYNEITRRDLINRYRFNMKVNSMISFPENYPDVMGIEAAFKAYQEHAKRDKNACQLLPPFKYHTCEQMFFITFANTMCGYVNKAAAMQMVNESEHSMNSVRVNAVVANNEDFNKAFRCPINTPMNPIRKCNLWK